jgi:tetratricopeptide (TPR) repeat protein
VATFYDADWSLAETEFKRAIELNPNYASAHQWYGLYWMAIGHLDEAEAEQRKALELDPLSLIINRVLAGNLWFQRRYDQAIEHLQKTLELDPNFPAAHKWLTFVYWSAGRYEDAIVHAEIEASLDSRMSKLPLFLRQMVSDSRLDAIRTLEDWHEIPPGWKGNYYAMLGEKEQAIKEWNKSLDEHAIQVFLKVWPFADPFRSDPRFQDLLLRMNLEP